MQTKIGIILDERFIADNYPGVKDSFQIIDLFGNQYHKLYAFDKYIDNYPFDYTFNNEDEFQTWINNTQYPPLYKYFLIPLDLVPNIAHYADFVKETFPELIFDVILDNQVITVEGVNVEVPVNQVKMIPCNCTRWTEEGLTLLDAVIENWNTTYPTKIIDFQVKFESYEEFKAFRDGHVQV